MRSRLALLLIGVLAVTFLLQLGPRLYAPFGASYDGFNAAVWSLGSRSLRTKGIPDSKFGAYAGPSYPVLEKYAHHPPLIYSAIALGEVIVGEKPVAARLPSVIASIAFMLLAYLLLREMQVDPLAAALAVILFVASPMVFVYGSMADTAMLGLPLAALLLLLWLRHRRGRPVPPTAMGLAALAACLASWQALAVAALLTAVDVVHLVVGAVRRRRSPELSEATAKPDRQQIRLERQHRKSAIALIVGTLVGAALVLAWVYWVYGSFNDLGDVAEGRIGGGSTFAMSLEVQLDNVEALLPVASFVIPLAVIAALWRRDTRDVGIIAIVVVVAYGTLFWSGAFIHDYWNYWIMLPGVIGTGIALNRLATWPLPRVWPFVAVAACVAVLVAGHEDAADSPARRAMIRGWYLGEEASARTWPPTQRFAFYEGEATPVISYYSRLPARQVGRGQVRQYCLQPDFLVLDFNGHLRPCGELAR